MTGHRQSAVAGAVSLADEDNKDSLMDNAELNFGLRTFGSTTAATPPAPAAEPIVASTDPVTIHSSGALNYASFPKGPAGQHPGWRVGTVVGKLSEEEIAGMVSPIPSQLATGDIIPSYASAEDKARFVHRIAWLPTQDGRSRIFLHSAPAGKDSVKRSGNIYSTGHLFRPEALDQYFWPVDLIGAPELLTPFNSEVVSAQLSSTQLTPLGAGENRSVAYPRGVFNSLLGPGLTDENRLQVLLTVLDALDTRTPIIIADDIHYGPLWCAAVSFCLSYLDSHNFFFSTFERSGFLDSQYAPALSLAVVPVEDSSALREAVGATRFSIINVAEGVQLGDDSRPTVIPGSGEGQLHRGWLSRLLQVAIDHRIPLAGLRHDVVIPGDSATHVAAWVIEHSSQLDESGQQLLRDYLAAQEPGSEIVALARDSAPQLVAAAPVQPAPPVSPAAAVQPAPPAASLSPAAAVQPATPVSPVTAVQSAPPAASVAARVKSWRAVHRELGNPGWIALIVQDESFAYAWNDAVELCYQPRHQLTVAQQDFITELHAAVFYRYLQHESADFSVVFSLPWKATSHWSRQQHQDLVRKICENPLTAPERSLISGIAGNSLHPMSALAHSVASYLQRDGAGTITGGMNNGY